MPPRAGARRTPGRPRTDCRCPTAPVPPDRDGSRYPARAPSYPPGLDQRPDRVSRSTPYLSSFSCVPDKPAGTRLDPDESRIRRFSYFRHPSKMRDFQYRTHPPTSNHASESAHERTECTVGPAGRSDRLCRRIGSPHSGVHPGGAGPQFPRSSCRCSPHGHAFHESTSRISSMTEYPHYRGGLEGFAAASSWFSAADPGDGRIRAGHQIEEFGHRTLFSPLILHPEPGCGIRPRY